MRVRAHEGLRVFRRTRTLFCVRRTVHLGRLIKSPAISKCGVCTLCVLLLIAMSVVFRPETLRHVCKEPLAKVQSVQLRGRGITRLVGLNACPNLTSLDISCNALTELELACFEGCKELWIVDASHNRLVSLLGTSIAVD